jgi:hypothetical protein
MATQDRADCPGADSLVNLLENAQLLRPGKSLATRAPGDLRIGCRRCRQIVGLRSPSVPAPAATCFSTIEFGMTTRHSPVYPEPKLHRATCLTIIGTKGDAWAAPYNLFGINLDEYSNVERWPETIACRPVTGRAYAIAKDMSQQPPRPARRTERASAKRQTA